MLPLLQIKAQTKIFWNPFRIRIFLFLSYSLGIKTINTFLHPSSSLENHTQFQTKVGEVYGYPFSDQNSAKTLPDRATHTYIAPIIEYPPPPPGENTKFCVQMKQARVIK